MRSYTAVLAGLFLSLCASAVELPPQILWPQFGFCSQAYRFDSYGIGLLTGFTDKDERARLGGLVDEGCYRIGLKRGQELRAFAGSRESGASDCAAQWSEGMIEGRQFSARGAGGACFGAGYEAGAAFLRVAARTGNADVAGEVCLKEYARGNTDAKQGLGGFPQAMQPLQACYTCGYDDGLLFPNRVWRR